MLRQYKYAASARRVADRFWAKVDKTGECWAWLAAKDRDGYGMFQYVGAPLRAHRVAYELTIGPIPAGLTLDHLCRNPSCVNPAHLEPVTNRENTFRSPLTQASVNARKTHCKHGHPFSGSNLVLRDGRRRCRACINRASREHTARKRLGVIEVP